MFFLICFKSISDFEQKAKFCDHNKIIAKGNSLVVIQTWVPADVK